MNDELKTLLVFGGTAALLTKARKPKTGPALPATTPQGTLAAPKADSVEGTFSMTSNGWEDTNYLGGFVTGAASVAIAWYAWSVFRPKIFRATTRPSV